MQTPKTGGRYKRLADGTVVPADTAAEQPTPNNQAPAHTGGDAPQPDDTDDIDD